MMRLGKLFAGMALLAACAGVTACGGGRDHSVGPALRIGDATASTNDPAQRTGIAGNEPLRGVVVGKPKLDPNLPLPSGLSGKQDACVGAGSTPTAASLDAARATIVCLLNAEREARGLGRLVQNGVLARPALQHARDMVAKKYFAHDSLSGTSFDERIKSAGYLAGAVRWAIGENLAWGAGDRAALSSIVTAWMNSPPHRANILKGKYDQIGIGIVLGLPTGGGAGSGETIAAEFGQRTPGL